MRKSFAREIFEKNGGTELALIELSELLQHSSVKITRIYLGISEDDITRQYMSLKLKAV
jgi:site-specific recombinase XerD